jgi:hypothetical protein
MPIDLLKLQTFDLTIIDYFNNNELLTWQSDSDRLNHFDNEVITTKKVKQYKGIYFCFYSSRLDILFKPHYYFNDNLHNANDFKIIDCINVINEFKTDLEIDFNLLKVVNIEFGLNVVSPIDIKDLITFLAYHERNEFRNDTGLPFSKKSYSTNKKGTANKYKFIKAYAKGLQFPEYTDINTYRFEVSTKMGKYCKRELNINSANDLLNVEVYFKMMDKLIKESKEVLILDCATNFGTLNPKELKKVNEYLNPLLWYKIKNQSRNSFSKNKKKYFDLINKVDDNLKNQLEKIIFDKLEFLKEGAYSTPNEIIKEGAYSNIDKGGICTQKNNNQDEVKKSKCKITGYNISMQKHDSILLSHTGLKYYFETDKKVFEQIKRKYLSKVWFESDFETQIKEIAHNIRNTKSNQTIKQKRIYKPQQYNLLTDLINQIN